MLRPSNTGEKRGRIGSLGPQGEKTCSLETRHLRPTSAFKHSTKTKMSVEYTENSDEDMDVFIRLDESTLFGLFKKAREESYGGLGLKGVTHNKLGRMGK
jgi:hypothetical protein